MSDLQTSLLIILIVAILVACVFIVSSARRSRQRSAIQHECDAQAWQYKEINERLHSAFVIWGDNWQLTSGMHMAEKSSQSGSLDAFPYTRWEITAPTRVSTPIQFGAAIGASTALNGDEIAWLNPLLGDIQAGELIPLPTQSSQDATFMLLSKADTPTDTLGNEVMNVLATWPKSWPLHCVISTDSIVININGKRMKTLPELLSLITLGRALIKRFAL